MKMFIPALTLSIFAATAAMAQNSQAVVTGAVDAPKNRTSATEAKEDTKAGNKQAIRPASAANQAAEKHDKNQKHPDSSNDSKPQH